MQTRPIRSQIYLPVLRFGITDEDWAWVIVAAVAGYAAPFLLGLKLSAIPLEMIGWVMAAGVTILALNLLRRQNRPAWLRHTLQAALQGRVRRRRLPQDAAVPWLK